MNKQVRTKLIDYWNGNALIHPLQEDLYELGINADVVYQPNTYNPNGHVANGSWQAEHWNIIFYSEEDMNLYKLCGKFAHCIDIYFKYHG